MHTRRRSRALRHIRRCRARALRGFTPAGPSSSRAMRCDRAPPPRVPLNCGTTSPSPPRCSPRRRRSRPPARPGAQLVVAHFRRGRYFERNGHLGALLGGELFTPTLLERPPPTHAGGLIPRRITSTTSASATSRFRAMAWFLDVGEHGAQHERQGLGLGLREALRSSRRRSRRALTGGGRSRRGAHRQRRSRRSLTHVLATAVCVRRPPRPDGIHEVSKLFIGLVFGQGTQSMTPEQKTSSPVFLDSSGRRWARHPARHAGGLHLTTGRHAGRRGHADHRATACRSSRKLKRAVGAEKRKVLALHATGVGAEGCGGAYSSWPALARKPAPALTPPLAGSPSSKTGSRSAPHARVQRR